VPSSKSSSTTGKKTPAKNRSKQAKQSAQSMWRYWVLGGLGAVLVAIIIAGLSGASLFGPPKAQGPALASAKWLRHVTILPSNAPPHLPQVLPVGYQIKGAPTLLYIGGDYCPYCAATRWPLVLAMAHFGQFTHLATMRSSSTDVYPNTATWTFYHDRYKSSLIDAVTIEAYSRKGPQSPLEPVTEPYLAWWDKLDAPPWVPQNYNLSIPFILIGGKYLWIGSAYNPQALTGVGWRSIIHSVNTNEVPMGPYINANANAFTAALCLSDGNRPGSVCNAPAIVKMAKTITGIKPGP
jgi:hypothetical protein